MRQKDIYEAVQRSSVELIEIESMLHKAGLHETAKAVNVAAQKLGWEAARKLEILQRVPHRQAVR